MRGLIGAIKQKKRVDVEYLSLNTSSFEDRVIQPHSLVKTGLRWHLRGYCEYCSEIRDFVLSRFRGNVGFAIERRNIPGTENWTFTWTFCSGLSY